MIHFDFNGEPWCCTHALRTMKYQLTKDKNEVDCRHCLKIIRAFKRRSKVVTRRLRTIKCGAPL